MSMDHKLIGMLWMFKNDRNNVTAAMNRRLYITTVTLTKSNIHVYIRKLREIYGYTPYAYFAAALLTPMAVLVVLVDTLQAKHNFGSQA